MVQLMAKDNNIIDIDNSVIGASALNGSRLHLNAKGSSLLAVQFINFLRSGSDEFNQSRKVFRSPCSYSTTGKTSNGARKLSYSSSQLGTPTLTSQRYFSSPISKQHNNISDFISRASLSRARLLKCSRFFFFRRWDLVFRPSVPSEDRGNWG